MAAKEFNQQTCIKLNVQSNDITTHARVKTNGAFFRPDAKWFIEVQRLNPAFGTESTQRYMKLKEYIETSAVLDYVAAQDEELVADYLQYFKYSNSIGTLETIKFIESRKYNSKKEVDSYTEEKQRRAKFDREYRSSDWGKCTKEQDYRDYCYELDQKNRIDDIEGKDFFG